MKWMCFWRLPPTSRFHWRFAAPTNVVPRLSFVCETCQSILFDLQLVCCGRAHHWRRDGHTRPFWWRRDDSKQVSALKPLQEHLWSAYRANRFFMTQTYHDCLVDWVRTLGPSRERLLKGICPWCKVTVVSKMWSRLASSLFFEP